MRIYSSVFLVFTSWHSFKPVSHTFLNSSRISRLAFKGSISAFISFLFHLSLTPILVKVSFYCHGLQPPELGVKLILNNFFWGGVSKSFSVNLHLHFVDGDGDSEGEALICLVWACLFWGCDLNVLLSTYSHCLVPELNVLINFNRLCWPSFDISHFAQSRLVIGERDTFSFGQ